MAILLQCRSKTFGYLEAKFNIGQSTGRKLVKQMRRTVETDGKHLFAMTEFL